MFVSVEAFLKKFRFDRKLITNLKNYVLNKVEGWMLNFCLIFLE